MLLSDESVDDNRMSSSEQDRDDFYIDSTYEHPPIPPNRYNSHYYDNERRFLKDDDDGITSNPWLNWVGSKSYTFIVAILVILLFQYQGTCVLSVGRFPKIPPHLPLLVGSYRQLFLDQGRC